MNDLIRSFGLIGGLAGLALGVLLLVFQKIIAENVLKFLSKRDAYKIILTIIISIWSISILTLVLAKPSPDANGGGDYENIRNSAKTASETSAGMESSSTLDQMVSPNRRRDAEPSPAFKSRSDGSRSDPGPDRSVAISNISQSTRGSNSPAIAGVGGDVTINAGQGE